MWNKSWTLFITLSLGFILTIPFAHIAKTMYVESTFVPYQEKDGFRNDASHLNPTPGMNVVSLQTDRDFVVSTLQNTLAQAKIEKRVVTIGGARHSMGGQSLYPNSIHIDMDGFSAMELTKDGLLHVQSGARWRDVVAFLHTHNLSVSVMQTNNDFSVGGSISVNAHGWQHNKGPLSSTVKAFDIMLADGTIQHCSRTENTELFSLALGGYGLLGVILDVWLEVVPNQWYHSVHKHVPLTQFLETWDSLATQDNIQMLYGRLNIIPNTLFEDVLITGYAPIETKQDFEPLHTIPLDNLKRAVFRGSENSVFGKKLRWNLETMLGGEASGKHMRSVLQNEPASAYANKDPQKTDILHEYFVPRDQAIHFVQDMAKILHSCDDYLLNVTIRSVDEDTDTILKYATEDVFAFVLLFTHPRTHAVDESMRTCTHKLVDNAIAHNGRFYLPYRLHPTIEQFHKSYPQYPQFVAGKLKYDPESLFQNMFYTHYLLK